MIAQTIGTVVCVGLSVAIVSYVAWLVLKMDCEREQYRDDIKWDYPEEDSDE